MKANRLRINNIELRRTHYKDNPYEFVKWYQNPQCNQERILLEGPICFKNLESSYTIAWLKKDGGGYYLQTVGNRLLELSKEERDTLFEIYRRKIKRR